MSMDWYTIVCLFVGFTSGFSAAILIGALVVAGEGEPVDERRQARDAVAAHRGTQHTETHNTNTHRT